MKKIFLVSFILLAIAATAYGMRCGGQLAQTGDSKADVLISCGSPLDRYFVEERTTLTGSGWITRPVEVWIYDTPREGVFHFLKFVGDKLVEIDWKKKPYGYER